MGRREATIEALYRVEGKAEIIGGEIVPMAGAGGFHGDAYRAGDPASPTTYAGGELAEAEPAVPGWSIAVSDLFPPE